jgi:hypothetical protein
MSAETKNFLKKSPKGGLPPAPTTAEGCRRGLVGADHRAEGFAYGGNELNLPLCILLCPSQENDPQSQSIVFKSEAYHGGSFLRQTPPP